MQNPGGGDHRLEASAAGAGSLAVYNNEQHAPFASFEGGQCVSPELRFLVHGSSFKVPGSYGNRYRG